MLGVLLAEFIFATMLLGRPAAAPGPQIAAPAAVAATPSAPAPASDSVALPDGRSAQLISLGGDRTRSLLSRIDAELDAAADAVTAFWGPDWRPDIVIVAAGTDEQFTAFAGGGADIAAATTPERIVFAPGAADMTADALRIVLRHELFHYAARADTAADAPRWLTEGVADFVGRSPEQPPRADTAGELPTDTELDTAGPVRTLAYDRAWWFAGYVADRYGTPALRELYVRACGHDRTDVPTAVRETLGVGVDEVLAGWRQWQAR